MVSKVSFGCRKRKDRFFFELGRFFFVDDLFGSLSKKIFKIFVVFSGYYSRLLVLVNECSLVLFVRALVLSVRVRDRFFRI